jgi:light-regulated signal transduction histidine kinase (bacteriophytochrome)
MYKFDEDYNGNVLAEASENFNESFLNHHFPASDIPSQARELYVKNRFRIIQDVDKEDISISPIINPLSTSPLNMSMCYLRSVSPVHMEYLKNMGVKASMSIS